jgi:hypothetical protein
VQLEDQVAWPRRVCITVHPAHRVHRVHPLFGAVRKRYLNSENGIFLGNSWA